LFSDGLKSILHEVHPTIYRVFAVAANPVLPPQKQNQDSPLTVAEPFQQSRPISVHWRRFAVGSELRNWKLPNLLTNAEQRTNTLASSLPENRRLVGQRRETKDRQTIGSAGASHSRLGTPVALLRRVAAAFLGIDGIAGCPILRAGGGGYIGRLPRRAVSFGTAHSI
jgi:hypothetical protein